MLMVWQYEQRKTKQAMPFSLFNKYLKCVSNRNAFYSLIVPLFCLALIYQHSFQGWNPWSVCVCVCVCVCVRVRVRACERAKVLTVFHLWLQQGEIISISTAFLLLPPHVNPSAGQGFCFLSNAGLLVSVEEYYGSCESSLAWTYCFSQGMEENRTQIPLRVLYTHYWVDAPFRKIIMIIIIRSTSLNHSRSWPSSQRPECLILPRYAFPSGRPIITWSPKIVELHASGLSKTTAPFHIPKYWIFFVWSSHTHPFPTTL
jgi:hypothetical protein